MTFTFLQRIWKIYSQLQHKNSPSSIQNGSQLQLLVADWLLTESSCSTTIIFAEVTISFQWRHIDTTSNSNKYNMPVHNETYRPTWNLFHWLKDQFYTMHSAYPVITDHCIDFPEETPSCYMFYICSTLFYLPAFFKITSLI